MPSITRLDKETEAVLQETAATLGITKSQIVRESVKEYCKKILKQKRKSPWDIYQSTHKPGGSGHGKRVSSSIKILEKQFEAKREKWSS